MGRVTVGALLVHVAEGSDRGLGQVLSDGSWCEAGPGGVETVGDGGEPGRGHRVTGSCMEEGNAGAGSLDGKGGQVQGGWRGCCVRRCESQVPEAIRQALAGGEELGVMM